MDANSVIQRVARESYGRLLAYLTARCADLGAAEDALGEAFRSALESWPRTGVPENPEGWFLTVARRRLKDFWRRAQRYEELDQEIAGMEAIPDFARNEPLPDERLEMLFLCAHPAIDKSLHAPLMLQAVFGLTAERIASTFLVRPSTLGQRLSRAKAKIRQANIRFDLPERSQMPTRLAAVLEAIYVAYGAGWEDPSGGEPDLRGLAEEALFLGKLVVDLLPGEAEARGLLALMLYCESRSAARRSADGSYVPLADQSCHLWSKDLIGAAEQHLSIAASLGPVGRFQLEAAIQSAHAHRITTGSTDWVPVETLYRVLLQVAPTAGARIAHIAAVGEAYGAKRGLEQMEALAVVDFAQYQPYWALLADLQRRAGLAVAAKHSYERAIGLCRDMAVRRFLLERAQAL